MKIQSAQHAASVARVGQGGERAARQGTAERPNGDLVSMSAEGSFVQSLRAEVGQEQGVRNDVVAEARAAIASGSLESSIDMDKVLDGLLADL